MKKIPLFFILLILLSLPAGAEWSEVSPGDSVRMPEHLYFSKEHRIQWWYFTGNLYDQAGREFGYELVFFAAGVQRRDYESEFGVDFLYLSHFAVTDVAENRFYRFSSADGSAYGFAGAEADKLRVWVDENSLEGSMRRMHILAHGGDDFHLDLVLVPRKPVVLHGDNGYSRKSEASPLDASLYFSFTNLETAGTLRHGEKTYRLTGKSWFDRELFSRTASESRAGWDWFSIRLDDNREIMLYEIRNKAGAVDSFSSGTMVYRNGTWRHLGEKDFTINILDHYTSEHTGARYPSEWEVIIPSEYLRLHITPLVRDQEFTEPLAIREAYWEGACRVEGSAKGRAYVELTGY